MFTAAHGRHTYQIALYYLQQRLLDTFAGDVTGDRYTGFLLGDFVAFVQHDDTQLSLLKIIVAAAEQAGQAVFYVGAHVSAGSELGAVLNVAGHVQELCDGLHQQGLPTAGGAQENDVGLVQLDFTVGVIDVTDPFVMIVDGHGEGFLCLVLAYYVFVQMLLDLVGAHSVSFHA